MPAKTHRTGLERVSGHGGIFPSHVPSRRNLALLLLEQGKTEEVTDLLLDLVLLAPEDPWAFGLLGRQYAARGERASAEAFLRKALALDPGDNHARINLATVLVEQEQTDEAQALFRQVMDSDPSQPNPYFNGFVARFGQKR